jgi:hypothetical protein
MKTPQHSPLPWKRISYDGKCPYVADATRESVVTLSLFRNSSGDWSCKVWCSEIDANTDLIIRAVNCHDELVGVVRNLLDDLLTALRYHTDHEELCVEGSGCLYCKHIREARDALAKAEWRAEE